MEETDSFLAHYGIKGMKWGVRRTAAQLDGKSGGGSGSGDSGSSEPKTGMSRKKKFAIGAAVVGGVAVAAVGAYAVNKHIDANKAKKMSEVRKKAESDLAARKAVQEQIRAFAKKSKWELATELPSKKPESIDERMSRLIPEKEKKSLNQRIQEQRSRTDRTFDVLDKVGPTPITKAKRKKQAEVKNHFDTFAKKSMWELATELPSPNKPSYSQRDAKKDKKLYGEQGAARIQKNLDKGVLLSEARKREATRQFGPTAAKVALNVNSATRRESKEFERLRKQSGGR